MIITAHQPTYLPWLGLFHKIALADQFVYYDHVQHSAHDYTARNFIKTSHGMHRLIVPLKKARSLIIKLKDLQIDQSVSWRRNHWNTIKINYARSKFFSEHKEFLHHFYTTEWKYIADMNLSLLNYLLETLGLHCEIIRSSDLNIQNVKSKGVLEMCQQLKATTIVFGEKGHNYVNTDLFDKAGIRYIFQDYQHPTHYPQLFGKFIPNLSILDLLLNCGKRSLEIIMANNVTKESIIN